MSPFCAQLSFLSSEKHVFRTGVSGRKFNSQSSFFFAPFPLKWEFWTLCGWKKKKIFVFSIYFAFLESSAEEELSVHTAQQLPSGHSLCLVGVARISHFWGSNEPQISLLCCSKCLRFHMASWGSYRKQRDIPDFSTGLSQRCFWTKVCAIELRFTELSTPFSHCRQFQGFLQDRKID